jgi:WD40 repeat protein
MPYRGAFPYPQMLVPKPAPLRGLQTWSIATVNYFDAITCLACNPQGDLIATGGDGGASIRGQTPASIRIWGAEGQLRQIFFGHTGKIESLAWSPNGRALATTGQDQAVRFWNVTQGRCVRTVPLNSAGLALAWSPGGEHLAVACLNTVAVVNPRTGELREVADGDAKSAISWEPNGRRLVVGSTSNATVYRVANLQIDRQIAGASAKSVVWSPDGKQIASTAGDKLIRVWDVDSCEIVRELTAEGESTVAIAWDPRGGRLASVGSALIVWDAAKGERSATVKLAPAGGFAVAWAGDSQRVVVAQPAAFTVHDAAQGTQVAASSGKGQLG